MALEADDMNVSRMAERPEVVLGGLPITRATMDSAADGFIAHALRMRGKNERPLYSTSANGQVLALCVRNPAFMKLMLQADQIHADGMPMVHYSKLLCDLPLPERVATTDLVHAVASRAEDAGSSFYFLGGSEEVNSEAVAKMKALYPRLRFAGRRNGYFKPEQEDEILADIREKRPDVLWIGLGFPAEQQFVSRNLDKLRGVGVIKTSGGLFDFLSGKNPRAPMWMQRRGLEWAYRMYNEPRRLTLRYMLTNPVAVYALLRYSR